MNRTTCVDSNNSPAINLPDWVHGTPAITIGVDFRDDGDSLLVKFGNPVQRAEGDGMRKRVFIEPDVPGRKVPRVKFVALERICPQRSNIPTVVNSSSRHTSGLYSGVQFNRQAQTIRAHVGGPRPISVLLISYGCHRITSGLDSVRRHPVAETPAVAKRGRLEFIGLPTANVPSTFHANFRRVRNVRRHRYVESLLDELRDPLLIAVDLKRDVRGIQSFSGRGRVPIQEVIAAVHEDAQTNGRPAVLQSDVPRGDSAFRRVDGLLEIEL